MSNLNKFELGNKHGEAHSTYEPEKGDYICAELANGRSLRSICEEEGMPHRNAVFRWIRKYPAFAEQYVIAKQESADCLADEMLDIADDATNDWMERNDPQNPGWIANRDHINRARLRVDTRKWIASKLKPSKYGERITHEGNPDAPIQLKGVIELVRPGS